MGAPNGRVNIIGSPAANASSSSTYWCLYAGAVSVSQPQSGDWSFTGDNHYGLFVGGEFEVQGGTADVYFRGSKQIDAIQEFKGADFWFGDTTYFSTHGDYQDGPIVWGTRPPITLAGSRMIYPPGGNTGAAGATGLFAEGNINAYTSPGTGGKGCSVCGTTTVTTTCGISLTGTNLDASCSSTGFGGLAWIPQLNANIILQQSATTQ
jgi:hypothetical protein